MSMLVFSQKPKVLLIWDGHSFQRHPKEAKSHAEMVEYSLSTIAIPSRQTVRSRQDLEEDERNLHLANHISLFRISF